MSSKNSAPKAALDPRAIYDHADRFHVTEFLLRNRLEMDEDTRKTVTIPGIVLSVFSAELYFKCLLVLGGQTPPVKHHLRELFRLLSSDVQQKIEAEWDKAMSDTEPMIKDFETKYSIAVPRDLATALSECGDAFQLMRYVYEGKTAKFYITQLPLVLRNTVRGITDWT